MSEFRKKPEKLARAEYQILKRILRRKAQEEKPAAS